MQMMPGDPFSQSTSIGGFSQEQNTNPNPNPKPNPVPKKKRNLPGTPDPDAEVIALSPKTLMATNRFICEICNKGFQRDQNLQLHRRGHNLPWKLRQRSNKEVKKKVYICPEKTCVHHDPSRALGDLTGIKKHFSRKHGEKKWKCEKCSKKYAVQSDWKAHTKTCGTREYKCDCGTLFSRKDSFITHRAFCDALAEESARLTSVATTNLNFKNEEGITTSVMNNNSSQGGLGHGLQNVAGNGIHQFGPHGSFSLDFNGMGAEQQIRPSLSLWLNQGNPGVGPNSGIYGSSCSSSGLPEIVQMGHQVNNSLIGSSSILSTFGVPATNSTSSNLSLSSLPIGKRGEGGNVDLACVYSEGQNKQSRPAPPMSATALLQKAAQMGSTRSTNPSIFSGSFGVITSPSSQTTTLNSNSNTNNNSNSNNNNNNNNNAFQSMKQPENFTSTTSNAAMMGSPTNFGSLTHSSNSFDQLVMQTNGQQSEPVKLKLHSNAVEHSLTRDFLGVSGGGGGAGHQFLPHELAKFASIGSSMGLTQFTGNQ
ncbi:zinc finger protein JACKDAW-like [Gastrolobium bilobum]|uniref:zinc finger protein JACKDAW-like n=1 Tax=Gastrolobium bilobum TaxID=150636 RepID=UPI002AB2453B|nr:zinc finger protein JACKDAW-like [Gastrolobium bilobum]